MRDEDFELALRIFQKLADAGPQVGLFNRFAAQAHIEFMRRSGWETGYMARAKRYLARAKKINARDRPVRDLEEAIAALDASRRRSGVGPSFFRRGCADLISMNPICQLVA